MHISPDSIFISIHPEGEHIVCRRINLESLMSLMPNIREFHHVNVCLKETSSMTELVESLKWLTESPRMAEDERSCSEVCCDITQAWNELRETGRPRVMAGVSAQGGTLYLAFVPPHVRSCTIEAFCRY